MVADQSLQFGDQLAVPPQPQVSLDAILQDGQPQLGQPVALGRRDVGVQELLEGLPPPQPERLAQQRPCGVGLPVGKDAARLGGQLLKARRVQCSRAPPAAGSPAGG